MRRNNILIFSVLLSIIILCFSFYLNSNNSKKFQKQIAKLERNYNTDVNMLKSDMIAIYENERQTLSEDIIVKNMKNRDVVMRDIFNINKVLVLRYSNADCSSCIKYALDEFVNFVKMIDVNRAIIISSMSPVRDLAIMASTEDIKNNIYSALQLGLPFENQGTPFMFIMDEKLTPQFFFVPRSEFPELTREYFRMIQPQLSR